MGPRPSLRGATRKTASATPEMARYDFLTNAASLMVASCPALAAHLGQSALLVRAARFAATAAASPPPPPLLDALPLLYPCFYLTHKPPLTIPIITQSTPTPSGCRCRRACCSGCAPSAARRRCARAAAARTSPRCTRRRPHASPRVCLEGAACSSATRRSPCASAG